MPPEGVRGHGGRRRRRRDPSRVRGMQGVAHTRNSPLSLSLSLTLSLFFSLSISLSLSLFLIWHDICLCVGPLSHTCSILRSAIRNPSPPASSPARSSPAKGLGSRGPECLYLRLAARRLHSVTVRRHMFTLSWSCSKRQNDVQTKVSRPTVLQFSFKTFCMFQHTLASLCGDLQKDIAPPRTERARKRQGKGSFGLLAASGKERTMNQKQINTPLKADHPERPTTTFGWSLERPLGILRNNMFLPDFMVSR